MAAKKRKRSKKSGHGGLGFMIAGAAAAASAATYYLYGPKGKQHRKQVKGWMLKASGEIMEQAERARHMDRAQYEALIARVADKYKKVKSIDNKDVEKLKKELKGHWKIIEAEAKKRAARGGAKFAKAARKQVHKTAVKVAKKTGKKK